jgi:hypothetical protein
MSKAVCIAWTVATTVDLTAWLVMAGALNAPAHRAWWPLLDLMAYGGAAMLGCTIGSWMTYRAERRPSPICVQRNGK